MNRSTNFNFYLPTNADPMLVSDLTYNFEQIDDKLAVANNLTTTAAGKVLDARQGKVLSDRTTTSSIASHINAASGVTQRSLMAVKTGDIITVSMWFEMSSSGNNDVDVYTIDTGYRPFANTYFTLCDTAGVSKIGTVSTDGKIAIYKPEARAYYGQVTYSV